MARAGAGAAALGALLVLGAGCAGGLPGTGPRGDPRVREVTARVLRPPAINLYDRDVETLGVVEFEGPSGPALARRLAGQVAQARAFRVVGPPGMQERLMRAGLAVTWDETGSSLRWVHERTGVDAVVVGRVEQFRVEEREETKETIILQPTGEYAFDRTEEGKIVYRETMAARQVPLYCRSDQGTVAAVYRVLDARRSEVVATVRHELSAQVPSFCYRGDVPDRLQQQVQSRLLERLFDRLNARFVDEIAAHTERDQVAFEVLPGRGDAPLVHRNELAILYASKGQWGQATELWQECLADQPDLPAIHYNLAVAYRARGRLTLALRHLNEALAASPSALYRREAVEVRALLEAAAGGGGW